MRNSVSLAILLLAATSHCLCASGFDKQVFDQQSIDALALRASQAQPREQCILYAELMHEMAEVSLRQYADGDVEKASSLLHQIQQIAVKMHLAVAGHEKRLKDAEMLLRHTAFRLTEMLHSSSYDDRPLVQQTLAQVNQAQDETMMQLFHK